LERVYEHPPGNHYRLQIWDTTGQEKYRSIAKIYYKDAKVAIMVYDVTDSYSLTSLKAWTEEVINCSPKDVILAVVGNKTDMVDLCRKEVEETEGKGYAKSVGAIFHETSAKDNKGLNELFGELCDIVY
jgi:Ras-related protein Rab-22